MSEYLDDKVKLSNKHCPHHYVGVNVSTAGCLCPPGRCWYNEQAARRKQGLQAITPEEWQRRAIRDTKAWLKVIEP